MKKLYIKVDSDNRVCLTKVLKNIPKMFCAYVDEGKIILRPVPEDEQWLFEPENREILERVQRGLEESKSGAKTYSSDEVKKMLNLKD